MACYVLASKEPELLDILEGGPNVFALPLLKGGQTNLAIVGIDVLLRAVGEDEERKQKTPFKIVAADFQRNPVGWVIHPEVGRRAGLPPDSWKEKTGKARNDWLFERLSSGELKLGDKVGTETTAMWLAWRSQRGYKQTSEPVPVGFDPKIVQDEPKLAYPVYLNEEPYKLRGMIKADVLVFDPADDGVSVYGNVLATTASEITRRKDEILAFREKYIGAWTAAASDLDAATTEVLKYYKGVDRAIVKEQIEKTIAFATFNSTEFGTLDAKPDGKLDRTLKVFQSSGSVSKAVTPEVLRELLI